MFEQVASHLPDVIYSEFRLALDCGRWKSGQVLTEKQKRICKEALFFYESNSSMITH